MKDNIKNSIVTIMHTNNENIDDLKKKSTPNINIARISHKDISFHKSV